MSLKYMILATRVKGITPVQSRILSVMAEISNAEGRLFPGYALIAERSEVCVKTVKRNVQKMADMGLLTKTNRRDGRRNKSNLYQLLLKEPEVSSEASAGNVTMIPQICNQSLPGDSICPQVGTLEVPLTITNQSINKDIDTDVMTWSEDEMGALGSHLLKDQHPYIYWFFREKENQMRTMPESCAALIQCLNQFGFVHNYCRNAFNKFLNQRRDFLAQCLLKYPDRVGYREIKPMVEQWSENSELHIQAANKALLNNFGLLPLAA